MSVARVLASSLTTSLLRYQRSVGLWFLLIAAPIAARYMIPLGPGAEGVRIAVGSHLPEMTSPFLGVSLGIVVSTMVLPVAWLYLRSNTTRRQPWQVEEVSPGSRVAIALGRFGADATVLVGMLLALTFSGFFLGYLILPQGALNVGEVASALWVVAAPSLLGIAAMRILFDAWPLMRGAFGDFVFFVFWLASIAVPAITLGAERSFSSNMLDFAGFVTPLVVGAPDGMHDFTIGGVEVDATRIQLDIFAGLFSPGYLESRLAWAGIAIGLVVLAGLLYVPHRSRRKPRSTSRPAFLKRRQRPAPAMSTAKPSLAGPIGLVIAEMRLIAAGWAFPLLAIIAAALAFFLPDFRHGGSAASLLLLLFATSSHAGRSEARGLVSLTKVAAFGPMPRRLAFITAGIIWSVLLGLPAVLNNPPLQAVAIASASGAVVAITATTLSALTGSAFAARLVLLAIWYAYISF